MEKAGLNLCRDADGPGFGGNKKSRRKIPAAWG
jgi:hypothetical protein